MTGCQLSFFHLQYNLPDVISDQTYSRRQEVFGFVEKTALFLVTCATADQSLSKNRTTEKAPAGTTEEELREKRSVLSVVSIGPALCPAIFIIMGSIKLLAFVGTLMPLRASGTAAAELRKDKDRFTNILLLGVGDDKSLKASTRQTPLW